MLLLDYLAEERINEAMRRGEFDRLEGAGRPLELDHDPLIPEELRIAYRILKNAGYLPPELERLCEIRKLEAMLTQVADEGTHRRARLRLAVLRQRLETGGSVLRLEDRYHQEVLGKLDGEETRAV
jgi:Domain of unknown function (DUF1992)